MSSVGIIPIRKISSRLPGKTFLKCAGKSLIEWTVDACSSSKMLDDFIVVSSCKKVLHWCKINNVNYIFRPERLETNTSPIIDTINWLNEVSYLTNKHSVQMLLQVTNPTREGTDIDKCIQLLKFESVNSICSVVNVGEFHPDRMFKGTLCDGLIPLCRSTYQWSRTQDLSQVYLRDGSIYAWKKKAFSCFGGETILPQKIVRYEVSCDRSIRIDIEVDLMRAEKILDKQNISG